MKFVSFGTVPVLAAAIGLVTFAVVLSREIGAFRTAVVDWARHDLQDKTELAVEALETALPASDFARIRAFGTDRTREGIATTIFTPEGGLMYDSLGRGPKAVRSEEGQLLVSRRCGEYRVRLGIPYEVVLQPVRRARQGLILAGVVGGLSILLVFLFTGRILRHARQLALERERQEKMLAELRRLEQFRRDFVSNVTHEIKTPLTGILGAVDMLEGAQDLPDPDRGVLLGLLRKEATRLDALAHDILSLATLEREGEDGLCDVVATDLQDVLTGVAEQLRPKAEAKGVALRVVPLAAGVDPVAACDARRVEQAVANLALNALRHSGSPDVVLSLAAHAEQVDLVVEDHGVGLAPEHQARVFERFYRVDKARSRDQGGTGLGLAIVKHIAQIHGGTVKVDSVSGKGCTFTLTLPRTPMILGKSNKTTNQERN